MEESIDLLFSKVGEMDKKQQQMGNQIDVSAQIMERMLKDQALLAKQIEVTGQAVAKLTLDQTPVEPMHRPEKQFQKSAYEVQSEEDAYYTHRPYAGKGSGRSSGFNISCRRCLFQGSLERIQEFGKISVWIISESSIYLNLYGFPQPLCVWMTMQLGGCKCTSYSMALLIGSLL
jgi:hypothetical protein